MPEAVVKFTGKEVKFLRQMGIAVYRNKIILDAQSPISASQLAAVEDQVDGELPRELIEMWKSSFGGSLDYDYQVEFGTYLYSASLRELFYFESDHYRDLEGWIDHELELAQETAEDNEEAIPERIQYLPFAGFEYLERFYVSLSPDQFGKVVIYVQGIPWKGRLNEDSAATVAESVNELFDQLSLDEDPFDNPVNIDSTGKSMVEHIQRVEAIDPKIAQKLKELVRSSVIDWQSIVETTDFSGELSQREWKALRLALRFAVNRQDIGLVARLHQQGAPFNVALAGESGVLCCALSRQAFEVVEQLLDLNVNLGESPVLNATKCPSALLIRLLEAGVLFDEEAIYTAAETGATDGAIALAKSKQVVGTPRTKEIVAASLKRADRHEADALRVEAKTLGSYLTPVEYREQSAALKSFAQRLKRPST